MPIYHRKVNDPGRGGPTGALALGGTNPDTVDASVS